jgi:hypothetical protein
VEEGGLLVVDLKDGLEERAHSDEWRRMNEVVGRLWIRYVIEEERVN